MAGASNKRLPITLGMIVKDEERLLPQCLETLHRQVAELIIVDTGSRDRTPEIAKKYGARLIHDAPATHGPLASARNIYLRHATQPWILYLDADERIAEKDIFKIRKILEKKSADAYRFEIRNYGDEYNLLRGWRRNRGEYAREERKAKTYGWWRNDIVRLFRNGRDYAYEGVHVLIEPSIRRQGGIIKQASLPIHHFECLKGADFILKKQKNYLRLSLEELKSSSNPAKSHADIATCLFSIKKADAAALEHLRRALRISPDYAEAHKLMGMIYLETGRPLSALKYLKQASKLRPKDADLHCLNGMALIALRKYSVAVESLQQALRLYGQHPIALNSMGVAYELLKDPRGAMKFYSKSLQVLPSFRQAQENLKRFEKAYAW